MKKIVLVIVFLGCNIFINAQVFPVFQWAKSFAGSGGSERANSITTDQSGNIYTLGFFSDTLNFNPGVSTSTILVSNPQNIFITKFGSNGNFLWVKTFITPSALYLTGKDIAIDVFGNIYITGLFSGTLDFDPGPNTFNLNASNGQKDIFVSKLDSNGNFVWVKNFGGVYNDSGNSIVTDAAGNIYVSAQAENISHVLQAVIYKLDTIGNVIWSTGPFGGKHVANDLTLDSNGNIYVIGNYQGTANFYVGTYNCGTAYDIYVAKINSSGVFKWVKVFPGTLSDGNSIAVDGNENVYFGGSFQYTVDFDPGPGIYNLTSNGNSDAFVSKIDSVGNLIWAKSFGNSSNYTGENAKICLDSFANVYAFGSFYGNVDFDPSAGSNIISPITGTSSYFSKLDSSGNYLWTKTAPNSNSEGYTINVDANSNILFAGIFYGQNDFDPGLNTFLLTPYNNSDVFISKFAQCNIPQSPINNTAVGNQNKCNGSSTTLSVSGLGVINWYSLPTSTVVLASGNSFITPTLTAGTYNYYAEANTCTVSASRTAITVTVNSTCQDVWPGDANSDGTANNIDVLELGLHYTQTGSPRATISNNWQSYFSTNWTGTISNGKNLNHSDCNGNGVINAGDTLAIYNNYSLTHIFKTAQTNTVNPQLSIVPDQAAVAKGTWGTASVYLGDATTNINNINGLAFTVDFDNTLIETNSIYIEYQPSFMDASQNLYFRKLDFATGKLFTTTTHTINNNISGFGKIATLHYQIKSSLTADVVLNLGTTQAFQSDASGAIVPLTSGTGTLMAMGSSVGLQENLNSNLISISPNPTNGLLTINSKSELQKIEVVAITGQMLLSEFPTNVSHTLHLENFVNGIYFVNVYQNDRIVKREKVVLNK